MTPTPLTPAREQEIRKQVECPHECATGGNDYIYCPECCLEWDYRRTERSAAAHVKNVRDLLSALDAERATVRKLRRERVELETESEGRRKVLIEKADELRSERIRCDNLEAERDALAAQLAEAQQTIQRLLLVNEA